MSMKMSPFDRELIAYYCLLMFYSNYGSIACRFWDMQCNVEKCFDLEIPVKGQSRPLKWCHSIDWVCLPITVL